MVRLLGSLLVEGLAVHVAPGARDMLDSLRPFDHRIDIPLDWFVWAPLGKKILVKKRVNYSTTQTLLNLLQKDMMYRLLSFMITPAVIAKKHKLRLTNS